MFEYLLTSQCHFVGPNFNFECLKTIEMMETVHEVMGDKDSESKQERDQNDDIQSQHAEKKQEDVSKTERELKDDVFNQLTNLTSMKGHYILITRRQEWIQWT